MRKLTFTLIFLLIIPLVSAQDAGITPDSKLYVFDKAADSISLALQTNSIKKTKKSLEIANERLAETHKMMEENKPEHADMALLEHSKTISNTLKHQQNINHEELSQEDMNELSSLWQTSLQAKIQIILNKIMKDQADMTLEQNKVAIDQMNFQMKAALDQAKMTKDAGNAMAQGMSYEAMLSAYSSISSGFDATMAAQKSSTGTQARAQTEETGQLSNKMQKGADASSQEVTETLLLLQEIFQELQEQNSKVFNG